MALGFEEFVNKLGLVPMRITDDNFAPYKAGSIAGFPPAEAEKLFTRGSAVPIDEDGEVIVIEAERVDDAPEEVFDIDIPSNIFDIHHLQRIALAKKLAGTDRKMNAEEADEIIAAELERRNEVHGDQVRVPPGGAGAPAPAE